MPYFQCPRCGGTDTYGQWEQRFNSQNITYKNPQGRVVGSSDGGFGVSNVRQQYCSSCVSVKMDMKLTASDWKVIRLIGIGFFFFMIGSLIVTGLGSAMASIGSIGTTPIADNFQSAPPAYFIVNAAAIFLLVVGRKIYKNIWIRRQDKLFLRDRFYKPVPPKSAMKIYIWILLLLMAANITYLNL